MGAIEGANDGTGCTADITGLLRRVEAGEEDARNSLFEHLYTDLRRRADALMRHQPSGHTLQATALVSEAFVKLCGPGSACWKDRQHFLMAAGRAMRHVLVDHARKKSTDKRSGDAAPTGLDQVLVTYEDRSLDLLALQDALLKLEDADPPMALAVELRFFAGASVEETARILDVPIRTLARRWRMTRAWLYKEVT